jgi:histidine phosphotransferase ChpT
MDLTIDIRVTELLVSRLCHDLVGPMGAVSNGMELLSEGQGDFAEDALDLASESATRAVDLLQYYRMAYGMAGNRQGADLTPMRELATRFFAHQKATLDWASVSAPAGLPDSAGKLILNMLVLGTEALPRGGTVGVLLASDESANEITVVAVGADAGLREESQDGLTDDVPPQDLTPRSVHAYFTRLLARREGGDLLADPAGPGHIRLRARLPL